MREVAAFLSANDAYFLLGLSIAIFLLLIYTMLLSRRLSMVSKRREARLEEGRVEDIIDCVAENAQTVSEMRARLGDICEKQRGYGSSLASCLQKVGIVRFNAFEDVGGEQSFAIALLDANRNGVVVSSLYGRQDSRLYAKSIINGEGERALSQEERRALEQALGERVSVKS